MTYLNRLQRQLPRTHRRDAASVLLMSVLLVLSIGSSIWESLESVRKSVIMSTCFEDLYMIVIRKL
jgi:hypothetical protein